MADFLKKLWKEEYEQMKDWEGLFSVDLMEHLIEHGMSYGKAHSVIGKLYRYAQTIKKPIREMYSPELKKFHPLLNHKVIRYLFNPVVSVNRKTSLGGTGFSQIRRQIKKWETRLRVS